LAECEAVLLVAAQEEEVVVGDLVEQLAVAPLRAPAHLVQAHVLTQHVDVHLTNGMWVGASVKDILDSFCSFLKGGNSVFRTEMVCIFIKNEICNGSSLLSMGKLVH